VSKSEENKETQGADHSSCANAQIQTSDSFSRQCDELFRISDIFTLVRTPNNEYYGEFHGSILPKEVMVGDDGINPA